MTKGLSPLISVTILIVIAISIASFMAPWMYELVVGTANETQATADRQVMCRNAGLDFDSSYGYYGVSYNFSANESAGESDFLRAKVMNTGTVNLRGFSFELTVENQSVEQILYYEPTSATQKTLSDPLRPSRSAIISANITSGIDGNTTILRSVKVITSVCPEVSPSIEI